jgi:hypothetical protein
LKARWMILIRARLTSQNTLLPARSAVNRLLAEREQARQRHGDAFTDPKTESDQYEVAGR